MDNALAERIKVSPSEEGSVAHRVNDGPEPGLPVVVGKVSAMWSQEVLLTGLAWPAQ